MPNMIDFLISETLRGALAESEVGYVGMRRLQESMVNDHLYAVPFIVAAFCNMFRAPASMFISATMVRNG